MICAPGAMSLCRPGLANTMKHAEVEFAYLASASELDLGIFGEPIDQFGFGL